jgi:hypothetical protein
VDAIEVAFCLLALLTTTAANLPYDLLPAQQK